MEEPKNNTQDRLTLRIPQQTKRELEVEADKRGISLNSLICTILYDYLEER